MSEHERLELIVTGPTAGALARTLSLGHPCPVRKSRLVVRFNSLSEGAFIMATVGTPVSVTFSTVLTKGQPITISAIDQDGKPTPPLAVTAASDNSNIAVTVDASDPLTFWLKGVPGSPGSASVTFTDAAGDTVVVSGTTVEPPASTTLIATPGTPV